MWGYFGQAYFGGADFDEGTAPPPPGGTRVAADAASSTDWDVTTTGIGSDDTATGTETATATGLGVGASTQVVSDQGNAIDFASATGLGGTVPTPPATDSRSAIRFVDSRSSSAAVRMELDAGYWRVLADGTDTPPPPMRDQRSSSMLTDGSLVTATVYDNREVTLALLLTAPTAAIAAAEIQKLQRELDRGTNILWWQPDVALPPQFINTYRGPDVTTDLDWGTSIHRFVLTIEAEPLGVGEQVVRSGVTVNHDPAATFNPCSFTMSGVLGDVDTPLYLTSTDTDVGGRKVAFATRRRGDPGSVRWFRQAEDPALTLGVDAARTVVPGASAGSTVRVNFASTPGNAVRLSGQFPSDGIGAGSVDWRGTYRVMVRARLNNGVIRLQVATGTSVASRNLPVLMDTTENGAWMVYDLGLVRLPVGNAGRDAGYGPEHPAGPSTLRIYAELVAGSGNVDLDHIFLAPADETYGLAQMPTFSLTTSGAVIDGIAGEVYGLNSAGELSETTGTRIPYVDGFLPTVSPLADTNQVFVLNGVTGGNGVEAAIGGQVTFDVTYWPLYRVIRPVAT